VSGLTFTDGAVRCRVGDYLLQDAGDGWRVFRVQDYVALERLVVLLRDDEPDELIPELPEGVGPTYRGPHVLLAAYSERFSSREAAAAAVEDGALGEALDGVCRPLAAFPAATTRVARAAGAR
jgi:hypothetical protein